MSLQIQMLGTGSAFSKMYYNTSALVRSTDTTILIDGGATTPKSLTKSAYSWTKLTVSSFPYSC